MTEFGGTFFAGSFSGVFFSYAKEKVLRVKTPRKVSQWKFKEEIPVRKNVGKIMQNVAVADLQLKRQSWHVSQHSKFNHSKQGKRFEDIKNRFNRYGGQAASRASEKNIYRQSG